MIMGGSICCDGRHLGRLTFVVVARLGSSYIRPAPAPDLKIMVKRVW